ncbi:MAG: bifunctional tetrahydrofolate synthase/dihydrofolate synthase [Coxiellaceae bacterium]|nr:bifunctional tetrahydrofolate synthase/dihydrofolate synthase [Coxiellaceae bacterium]
MKTLQQWLEYIYSLHTSRIDLGLQRIESIAEEQGLRHFPCPVVTVAGTNGKGSCIRTLESIYRAAGYRVGAYYSPHLLRFNERIRIQEKEVSDDLLITAFEKVEAFRKDRSLSFFEFTTLAALVIFRSLELDVVLLEVGLGGRLDAVNVVEPDVSVVTSIALDHQDWLGDTREKIAFEKAGIYRADKPAICGDWDPPTSLLTHAENINADFFRINKDFSYEVAEDYWNWSGIKKSYQRLPIPALKCQNAATSLMAIECLQRRLPVNAEHIITGLKSAKLSGRFEVFSRPVKGILDVAHNPDSARWLADQLERHQFPAKKVAVVGMLGDKDIPRTLDYLLPHIDVWFVAGLDAERAADPQEIMMHLKTSGVENCYNFCTVPEALKQAMQACTDPDDRVIVFGSFHTVAEVQKELNKEV